METNYNENEELRKLAPHLFKMERKEVFEVPENYFEKLPGMMQEKVHAGIKPKSFWVPDYKVALALASICLLILVGIQFLDNKKQPSSEIASSEFAQDYDEHYLAAADELDLADQLDDESLANTSEQIDENSGLSNSEIEDYLITNNIELSTLTNEF